MKRNIIRLIIEYIIGFGIYIAVLYLTQNILLNVLGIDREEIHILFDNMIANIFLYTLLFSFITLMLYAYDKTSAKELNETLKEMKERVKANEEEIRKNMDNNIYSISDSNRNL